MIFVEPSATLLSITPNALQLIERAGRSCYKSEDRITEDSAEKFVAMLRKRGHLSVLEHASASILFVTDRGISHELVRHRIASYSQESSRYCNYGKDKFGSQISMVMPSQASDFDAGRIRHACSHAQEEYLLMIKQGTKPEIARAVLPTCLKTEIVATMNFRQWLEVFRQRTAPAAHPDMQHLMRMAKNILAAEVPCLFEG